MSATFATVDVERLNRRYSAVKLRFASLQGQAKELQMQRSRLVHGISMAKGRIELAPEATEVFNYLQEQAHARAVGDFEDLLSAFVADVVPDAGKIHLELGTERGAPALDILLDNGGDFENILKGNGGGVTNVVITGLGFSALARTSNRQLMLLDEPDCWLQAKNVPNFTKVIAEVANPRPDASGTMQPGCQTLMISHNDISLMDDGAHIQNLQLDRSVTDFAARWGVPVEYVGDVSACAYVVWVPASSKNKEHIEVRYRHGPTADDTQNALTKGYPFVQSIAGARAWPSDMPGVRWIEVENVTRHVKTRLDLSPGLNVLSGEVNGGKSSLYFTALRAVAYGESDDTIIRHGAEAAVIRVCVDDDIVIEFVRKRKGGPKAEYRRYQGGVLTNKESPDRPGERAVPDFVTNTLKISRVDGLDIQLRSQKEPIFLLNETPSRRAQLLSVGRESGLLQDVIERHRLQLKRDKELVKRDEIELNLVNRTLTVLSPLGSMSALCDILDASIDDARQAHESLEALRSAIGRLEPLQPKAMLYGSLGNTLSTVPPSPVLHEAKALSDVSAQLSRTTVLTKLPDMPVAPMAPSYVDTQPMGILMAALKSGSYAHQLALNLPPAPISPAASDTVTLKQVLTSMQKGLSAHVVSQALPDVPLQPALRDTTDLRRDGVALAKHTEAIVTLTKEEVVAVTEVTAAVDAEHELKHTLGVCPTCDRAFEGV